MINLSVDGGGTKINVIAFDEYYHLLGFGVGGGINIRYESTERVYEHISTAINDCMKNINEKHINTVYCTMVGGHHIFKEVAENMGYIIGNFIYMREGYTYLLAGGLTDKGYVALSGTGSGALYCNRQDNILHLGGYGTPIGDDGSGAWIGIKGINAVTRYLASWGEETTLKNRLYDYLGITDKPQNILNALYPADKSIRSLYAKFAVIVGEEANAGDRIALGIVKEAGTLMGEQLIGVVNTQVKNNDIDADYNSLHIDVFACGGAWKCSKHMFNEFSKTVIATIPNASCYIGKFDPVVGGVIQDMIDNEKEVNEALLKEEYKLFLVR